MKRIELISIDEDIYLEVGRLTMLFSHIEWLIANAILLCKVTPDKYKEIKDLSITQDYFETLLALNFSRKMGIFAGLGFDVANIRSVSEYRNTVAHGIIFKNETGIMIKKVIRPDGSGVNLHKDEVLRQIESLKLEGGKVLDFIESKGYAYHEPQQ